jgi:hypothetical protein
VAVGFALVRVQLVVPFGVPRPSPTTTDAGPRLVSVTLTAPACETVNVKRFELCCSSEPENVSVVPVAVVVGDVEPCGRPQAEVHAANVRRTAALVTHVILLPLWRFYCRCGAAQSPDEIASFARSTRMVADLIRTATTIASPTTSGLLGSHPRRRNSVRRCPTRILFSVP